MDKEALGSNHVPKVNRAPRGLKQPLCWPAILAYQIGERPEVCLISNWVAVGTGRDPGTGVTSMEGIANLHPAGQPCGATSGNESYSLTVVGCETVKDWKAQVSANHRPGHQSQHSHMVGHTEAIRGMDWALCIKVK
jgi:hypothetical protein